MPREIRRSTQFKKDFKKLCLSGAKVQALQDALVCLLDNRQLLPERRDHALTGNWGGYREFHLGGDLLVIYKLTETDLFLARMGSHSELFR